MAATPQVWATPVSWFFFIFLEGCPNQATAINNVMANGKSRNKDCCLFNGLPTDTFLYALN